VDGGVDARQPLECAAPDGGDAAGRRPTIVIARRPMPQDSPAVVYVTIAVLMTAFSVLLLVVPFDVLVSGEKTRAFMTAVSNTFGEWGTRLLFAVASALLAYVAFRRRRKSARTR